MKDKRNIRLNIQIDEKMRYKLKENAAKRNVSLREYILGILNSMLEIEDIYK